MLEYLSDGLEYNDESDIKVLKLAEIALYNYVNYNYHNVHTEYHGAEKAWLAEYRNAKNN
jgi:hypothetical protein